MAAILSLTAREVIDSRGEPTLEVSLATSGGKSVASVPAGASVGSHEAKELRDGDPARFGGRGVLKAVSSIKGEIASALVGKEFSQEALDTALAELDATSDKSRLGANALLGVSMAFARAVAKEEGIELFQYIQSLSGRSGSTNLPEPHFNILNGGRHADSGLSLQEFMVVPRGIVGMKEKIRVSAEIYGALKNILKGRGLSVGVGDEGGFAPRLSSTEEALDLLSEAIATAGYLSTVHIALDAAASEFLRTEGYTLSTASGEKTFTRQELAEWYLSLVEKYPIISIEDPFAEDDTDGFILLRTLLAGKALVIGDDLTVTNAKRVEEYAALGAIDGAIIKPNQIGTVSETVAAADVLHKRGLIAFASHRSGETTDTFLADLAVGLGCQSIKSGACARGERVVKYNRLMEIADLSSSL